MNTRKVIRDVLDASGVQAVIVDPADLPASSGDLTRDDAFAIGASVPALNLTARELFLFQAATDILCVPFPRYQRAAEEALGRPVLTHEFGDPRRLLREFFGVDR